MNIVFLSGNLAATPEVKVVRDTLKVCNFSLAVKSEGKEPTTDFYDLVSWNKTAELIGSSFVKGNQVSVRGKLKKESWVDKKTNAKVNKFVVNVDEVLNLPARQYVAATNDVSNETDYSSAYQESITF